MNVVDAVSRVAHAAPDKSCLTFEGRVCTYGQLAERTRHVAGVLKQSGVERGDRVALLLPNVPAFIFAYLGTLYVGAIAVSLSPSLTSGEIGFALDDSGAEVVVSTHALAAKIPSGFSGRAIIVDDWLETGLNSAEPIATPSERMGEGDPAAIVYSSGTTGRPKGVVLSHGNVAFTARSKTRYMGVRSDDTLLLFLPLHHCFGQNAVLNVVFDAGAAVVLHRNFDREAILKSIARNGITMFFGVPTTFLALYDCATPEDLQPVRYFLSGGASLPVELERRWREKFGRPIYQGYGLSESSPFATYNHEIHLKPGTVGTPIDGVELRIVDPNTGEIMPADQPGEIVIRGPNVMIGYWNRPEDTAAVLKDGWLHTGDIGRVDQDGFVRVEDRLKDMIIVGGLNVYPVEVENAIYRHAGVAEVAVFGIPDPFLGEEVWAHIVPKSGQPVVEEDIIDICRRHLAGYKIPAHIELVENLPKNPTGKILKRVIRDAIVARVALEDGRHRNEGLALKAWVSEWLSRHLALEAEELDPDRPFAEYGLDSLRGVSLARDLGKWLGRPLDPTTVWQFPTLNTLLAAFSDREGRLNQAGSARLHVPVK